MAAQKTYKTQTDTGTWAGDSSISTNLDKNGVLTELRATVEVTPSAALTVNQPDGLFRVIQNLRIEGGGDTYITLPAQDVCEGGILLHYMNLHDGYGYGHHDNPITAPHRTYTPITFVYHMGSRAKNADGSFNHFDLTGLVPLTALAQPRAIWVTSGNDVMDDGVTITSAVLRLTLAAVSGTEAEIRAEMARQGIGFPPGVKAMVPRWSAEDFAHTATASDYATTRDLDGGGFLKRICIIEQDATGTRAGRAQDEVTGVSVVQSRDGTPLVKAFVDQFEAELPLLTNSEADDAAADFQGSAPIGIYIIDLRQLTGVKNPWGRDWGLDLRNYKSGDYKLGLTITTYASGDHSGILQERYIPIMESGAFV